MHFLKNKNNQESNFTKFRGKKSSGNICEIQSSDFEMIPAYSRSLKTYDNYISTKSLNKVKESKYSNGKYKMIFKLKLVIINNNFKSSIIKVNSLLQMDMPIILRFYHLYLLELLYKYTGLSP